jgi:hypothetical protein
MPRLSTSAVAAALRQLALTDLTTRANAALEAYLVAKRMERRELEPTIAHTDDVVDEVFRLLPGHPLGRVQPFLLDKSHAKPKWAVAQQSGRKTVWNASTRGDTDARKLFKHARFPEGLSPNAALTLASLLKRRGGEAARPPREALLVFLLRDAEFEIGATVQDLQQKLHDSYGIEATALNKLSGTTPLDVPLWGDDPWPGQLPGDLTPTPSFLGEGPTPPWPTRPDARLVVDPRVRRMVERAIVSSRAVLLVGPPGTGKTSLLNEVAADICTDPGKYGLGDEPFAAPHWVSAEEGWTSRELVGGETVVNGEIMFQPGHLLNSISKNRWLAIDELNRADMDRIFGPLFTWMSGSEGSFPRVLVGSTRAAGGVPIELGWVDDNDCSVENEDLLGPQPEQFGGSCAFLAGRNWRLLGTYNAVDAQLAFRLGEALGRRFVRVPVPPISPEDFRSALETRAGSLPQFAQDAVLRLYSAHLSDRNTALGPALFLRMVEYLKVAGGRSAEPNAIREALPEAYLVNVGVWLARLEDEDLGALIDATGDVFSSDQWMWVRSMLPNLA